MEVGRHWVGWDGGGATLGRVGWRWGDIGMEVGRHWVGWDGGGAALGRVGWRWGDIG